MSPGKKRRTHDTPTPARRSAMSPGKKRRTHDTDTTNSSSGDGDTSSANAASKRISRSVFLDSELIERIRAAVTYLSAYVPEAEVRSQSDILEPGARAVLDQLERDYNNGQPFPRVNRMPTGRPRQQ